MERKSFGDYKFYIKKLFEKGERPMLVQNGFFCFVLPKPYAIVSYFLVKYYTL